MKLRLRIENGKLKVKTEAQLFREFIEGLEPPDRTQLEKASNEFKALIKERRDVENKTKAVREEA